MFVFTRTKKDGAERVPESEWKVIEAISSTFPSTLDVTTARISDGPLKDLLLLQIDPTIKAVLIRAKLLGETRDYWLPVRFADGTEKKKAETEKKPKPVYTDEKRTEMLAKAEEIGITAAAKAYGVPWQTIAQLKRWAVKSGNVTAKKKNPFCTRKEPEKKIQRMLKKSKNKL